MLSRMVRGCLPFPFLFSFVPFEPGVLLGTQLLHRKSLEPPPD